MLRALIASSLLCVSVACSSGEADTGVSGSVDNELWALCEEDLKLSVGQCQQLAELALPEELPEARGNRYADDEAAALLGFRIFYDSRISNHAGVRCATCHQPERYFGDGARTPEAIEGRPGIRNSPSILTAAWTGPFVFWDGRADSLWSQPLFAFEHPDEMASSRLELAHAVRNNTEYRTGYVSVFGQLPALEDAARFPAAGKPGEASFDAMSREDQDAINRVAANVGKSIEAYMRKVAIGPGSLELFLKGQGEALTESARRGLAAFVTTGCIDCHSGPALSDGKFHRIGSGTSDDLGRAGAIEVLQNNPFNSKGPYADADVGSPVELPLEATESDQGAFRTPSLRAVSLTGPYGHAGQYATLADLLAEHTAELDAAQRNALEVFLLSLDGRYPERPWSDWPVL